MIYYIFYELIYGHFKDQDWWLVKALNVFQYVTFRTAYGAVTAMLIALLSGGRVINGLKRWNIGQQIREEGPQAHIAKRDTPTMRGLLVIVLSSSPNQHDVDEAYRLGARSFLVKPVSVEKRLEIAKIENFVFNERTAEGSTRLVPFHGHFLRTDEVVRPSVRR